MSKQLFRLFILLNVIFLNPLAAFTYSPDPDIDDLTGRGSPENDKGAGRRGGCDTGYTSNNDSNGIKIKALVPIPKKSDRLIGGGLSLSDRPVVFVYVPYFLKQGSNLKLEAEIVLRGNGKNQVHRKNFVLQDKGKIYVKTPGIIPFQIEEKLEANTPYTWSLSLICPPNKPYRSGRSDYPSDSGIIIYKPNSSLLMESNELTVYDKVVRYAEKGYWYDAIEILASKYKNNDEARKDWNNLLNSVGLNKLVEK